MCMLCVVPPHVIPAREKLENSALNNPHGFGFAIVIPKEKRIHSERTMNADTSINRFLEMRAKYPEGYAMWHARFATHGSTTVDNCHPFKVGNDSQTYLAHNGVLPIIEPKGDKRSDTRIFAEDLLPAIGGVASLDNPQVSNLIDDFTTGSKVCVLTVDPRAKYQCYLFHKEKGFEDNSGVWWSNDSCYLSSTRYFSNKSYDFLQPTEAGLYDVCGVCNIEYDAEMDETGYCPECNSCYMCYTSQLDCLCYQGSELESKRQWGGWGW